MAGSASAQEEIDRKNEELLMMLKSFEEQEDEEEQTAGKRRTRMIPIKSRMKQAHRFRNRRLGSGCRRLGVSLRRSAQ